MAMFLKLTIGHSGDAIFINVEQVTAIQKIGDETFLFYQGEDHSIVKETPEQIMQMIAQSQPVVRDFAPLDAYRRPWYQPAPEQFPGWGPPSVPSGPWSLKQLRDAQPVTSFDQAAEALLRPIGCQPSDRDKPVYDKMMKAQEDLGHCKDHSNKQANKELLDGPPDM